LSRHNLLLFYLNELFFFSPTRKLALFLRAGLFLACYRATGSTPSASVSSGSLTSYWQSHPVTPATVCAYIHQPLDVHRFPTAQVPFYLIVAFHRLSQCGYIRVT